MSEYWYLLPLIIIFTSVLWRQIIKTKVGKRVFDKSILQLPVISGLVRETNSATLARTLSSLTNSGVPLVRSLEIIAGTMGNVYFQEALRDGAEKVKKGAKLSASLKRYDNLYFPIVIQMLEVGEETGETSKVLGELADFLEEEAINSTKNIASLIEPLMMLVVGAAVGFFAISMLQPMYSMLEAV
jgi:type IV pilus assembly protein PilC